MDQSKKEKLGLKISNDLLGVLAKMVVCFHDPELNEKYNRIELQVKQLEDSWEPSDYTYLRDLCNQFDDKLIAMCREKSDMVKMLQDGGMLKKMGLDSGGPDEGKGERARIMGFSKE